MDKISNYQTFACLAQCQSFTKTAQQLQRSKAMISASIRELEESLGTRLFHRTTRTVSLTQDGSAFYERCIGLLHDLEELEASFQNPLQQIHGRLRIDLPTRVARNLIVPKLPQLVKAHPELRIELSCTDRRVDLVSEGFDLVLRVGSMQSSSLIARPLGYFAVLNVASPEYLKRFGAPKALADLTHHLLVHYQSNFSGSTDGFEYFDGKTYQQLAMNGVIAVNNADAYEAACIAGLGIAQMPVVGARALLESGALKEVLPKFHAEPMPVQLVYASSKHLSQRVRVLMDWLSETLKPWLD